MITIGEKIKRLSKKTVLVLISAVCFLAVLVLAVFILPILGKGKTTESANDPLVTNEPPREEDHTNKIADISPECTPSSAPAHLPVIVDPPLWDVVLEKPFIIVKTVTVSNSTKRMGDDYGNDINCVRAECEVLFEHRADRYVRIAKDSETGLAGIYITEDTAESFLMAESLLIPLIEQNADGKLYALAETDIQGVSTYIPITESGLDMAQAHGEFDSLEILNTEIKEKKEKGLSDGVYEMMPDMPIDTGMTVDEIKQWFGNWDRASDLLQILIEEMRNGHGTY